MFLKIWELAPCVPMLNGLDNNRHKRAADSTIVQNSLRSYNQFLGALSLLIRSAADLLTVAVVEFS